MPSWFSGGKELDAKDIVVLRGFDARVDELASIIWLVNKLGWEDERSKNIIKCVASKKKKVSDTCIWAKEESSPYFRYRTWRYTIMLRPNTKAFVENSPYFKTISNIISKVYAINGTMTTREMEILEQAMDQSSANPGTSKKLFEIGDGVMDDATVIDKFQEIMKESTYAKDLLIISKVISSENDKEEEETVPLPSPSALPPLPKLPGEDAQQLIPPVRSTPTPEAIIPIAGDRPEVIVRATQQSSEIPVAPVPPTAGMGNTQLAAAASQNIAVAAAADTAADKAEEKRDAAEQIADSAAVAAQNAVDIVIEAASIADSANEIAVDAQTVADEQNRIQMAATAAAQELEVKEAKAADDAAKAHADAAKAEEEKRAAAVLAQQNELVARLAKEEEEKERSEAAAREKREEEAAAKKRQKEANAEAERKQKEVEDAEKEKERNLKAAKDARIARENAERERAEAERVRVAAELKKNAAAAAAEKCRREQAEAIQEQAESEKLRLAAEATATLARTYSDVEESLHVPDGKTPDLGNAIKDTTKAREKSSQAYDDMVKKIDEQTEKRIAAIEARVNDLMEKITQSKQVARPAEIAEEIPITDSVPTDQVARLVEIAEEMPITDTDQVARPAEEILTDQVVEGTAAAASIEKTHAHFLDFEPKVPATEAGRHIQSNSIKAQMLGTACVYGSKEGQPAGCFTGQNVPCEAASQAVRGTCRFGGVAVPQDHPLGGTDSAFKVFRGLDRGTQIKMHLHRARLHYNNAVRLFTTCNPHAYDRFFTIIKSPKGQGPIHPIGILLEPMKLAEDPVSYSAEWEKNVIGADSAAYWTSLVAPEYVQGVHGPHKGYVNVHSDGKARPSRIYKDEEGKKLGTCLDKAEFLLNLAMKHFYNATILTIIMNYKENLVMPGTRIPLGAYIFITDREMDSMLSLLDLVFFKDPKMISRQPSSNNKWDRRTYVETLRYLSQGPEATAAHYREVVSNIDAAVSHLDQRPLMFGANIPAHMNFGNPEGIALDVAKDDGSTFEASTVL